jgi:hypothetical protein
MTLPIIAPRFTLHASIAIPSATTTMHAPDGHRSDRFVPHQQARSVTLTVKPVANREVKRKDAGERPAAACPKFSLPPFCHDPRDPAGLDGH